MTISDRSNCASIVVELFQPDSLFAILPGMDERALHTVNQVWAWVAEMLAGLAALPGFSA